MEPFYPLHVFACERCWLVQLESFVPPDEIFTEYAYFSAYSSSWVEHARLYVEMIRERLALGPDDLVVELASNDGYLLQHFVGTGIPILGIDPGGQRGASSRGARRADARRVLRAGDRGPARRRGHAREPRHREQRPRAGARSERLPGRREDDAARRRHRDVRVPAPAAPTRRAPVRHDLPRALLVLLDGNVRGDSAARTGSRHTTSRSSPRTAARFASTRSMSEDLTRRRTPYPRSSRARRSKGCALRSAIGASPRA